MCKVVIPSCVNTVSYTHLDVYKRQLPGLRNRVIILDMPELEIASHVIQQRVRNGQPIRHMAPRSVEAYIQKQNLFRG